MRVAIPTNAPGGMESDRSDHFGHCDVFTIINFGPEKSVENVETLANGGHEAGGCMVPVQLLQDAGVEAIVVGGMGARPMQGFAQAGIKVYFAGPEAVKDVESVVSHLVKGQLPLMHATQVCKGSSDCQH